MGVNVVHIDTIEKPIQNQDNYGTLAILAALSIVRDALTGNQLKMASSYDEFSQIKALIQDKLSGEFKTVLALKKDAIDRMKVAGIIMGIVTVVFLVSYVTPASLTARSAAAATAKSLLGNLAILGGMVAAGFEIAGASIQLEVADLEEKNTKDQGLLSANTQVSQDLGDKIAEIVKTITKAQEMMTEIINSMGAAMHTAAR